MRTAFLVVCLAFPLLFPGKAALARQAVLRSAELGLETLPVASGADTVVRTVVVVVVTLARGSVPRTQLLQVERWRVQGDEIALPVHTVRAGVEDDTMEVTLRGPFVERDDLTVSFDGGKAVAVADTDADIARTHVGSGESLDLGLRRLATEAQLWAVDFDLGINLVEHRMSYASSAIGLRSLRLVAEARGGFASSDTLRNGVETDLAATADGHLLLGGMIYRGALSVGMHMMTGQGANSLVEMKSTRVAVKAEMEIPFTNYPMMALHRRSGFARLAMPLTVQFAYLPRGTSEGTPEQVAERIDLGARYELALSPLLIVQGAWRRSILRNLPPAADNTFTSYTISLGQDANALVGKLGPLGSLLGPGEDARGQNFLFFRSTWGRRAPLFQDVSERSFGFATFF